MRGAPARERVRVATAGLALAVAAVLGAAPAQAAPATTTPPDDARGARTVEPVDLQVPGRGASAHRISESGVVVGVAYTDEGPVRAFRWEDGEAVVLSGVDGDSNAVDVNEAGQVLVETYRDDGSSGAVLWQPDGTVTDLAPGSDAYPGDLDDQGRVALDLYDAATGHTHAAVWQDGALTPLDESGAAGSAVAQNEALNERGDVAGTLTTADGPRAVLWRDGVATVRPLPADAYASASTAVNERGDVLGVVYAGAASRAVVWEGGRLRYLAPAGSPRLSLYDFNDRGAAVGTVGEPGAVLRAAHADRRGLTMLPTLGGPSGVAYAVNARGVVVGGTAADGDLAYNGAVAWVRGVAVPLSGWVDDRPPVNSMALDVDEQGRAVGYVQRQDAGGSLGLDNMRALLWEVTPRR